jgi:hypothetical protein
MFPAEKGTWMDRIDRMGKVAEQEPKEHGKNVVLD